MLWFLMLTAVAAAEGQPVAPVVYTLEAAQNVWDMAATDLNQDGFKDILLLTNDEKAFPLCKEVAAHVADASGAYPAQPTSRLALPVETGAVFLAEVAGGPPVEVVAAHGAGAVVYQFGGGAFTELGRAEFDSLFPTNSREPSFIKQGALDLNGDGIDEWLIPTARGLRVRTLAGDIATVPCDVVSEMRSGDSLYIVNRLPDFQTFDAQGESLKGLAFLSDEFADFAWSEGWANQKRVRLPMNLEEKWDATAVMKDITGDKFPDLVVTQTRGTVRLYAEIQVYLAREPFVYPETPDAVFPCSGAVSSPMVMDVNGDKLLDLVFIRIPFGVGNIVNFFVRGKISVHAEVHLFDGKQYREKPDYSTGMTMDAPEGRSRVAYTFGDFSGDGRIDVAYGSESDTLAVFTGDPKRFISSRPWQKFTMPSFGNARAFDLNGNKAEDILLIRPGSDKAKRADVIVF